MRDSLWGICQVEELNRICEIVSQHNQRDKSKDYTPEIKLVQDADCLDHVGPLGPWLAFYWSGIHAETINDALRFFHSDERTRCLARMRQDLNFDISVSIFDQRVEFEARFFYEFERIHQQGL